MITFEKDYTKMGFIGLADYVIVLSEPNTCLVTVIGEIKFEENSYVQVISLDKVHELYYTLLEHKPDCKIITVGDGASKDLDGITHTKVKLYD